MKKLAKIAAALIAALALTANFASCTDSEKTIVVGASATPHAEILKVIEDNLEEQGWKLEIRVFDDYITPNTALDEGSLDANYFQHTPYLNTFNSDYGTDLVAVEKIHYEPFGLYGKNVAKSDYSGDFEKTGKTILVPNDGSNLTRALFLLQDEGFITLAAGADATENLTVNDIADAHGNTVNPVEAQAVTAILEESDDGTLAVVNGNYALQAQLSVADALAVERADGDAASLYANIIAVKSGNENSEKTKALIAALKTREVYDYITETYNGAVLPVFEA